MDIEWLFIVGIAVLFLGGMLISGFLGVVRKIKLERELRRPRSLRG